MVEPGDSNALHDIFVVLAAAGLVIPAFAAIRISPVVGFILVGILVGPHGLGALAAHLPWLAPLTIAQAHSLEPAAEIGIAMLLFSLGLELSRERLRTMGRSMVAYGPAQLVLCTAAIALLLLPFDLSLPATLAVATALAMSSTAVVLQLLTRSGRMRGHTGRAAFAMLLFQDIALAPILLLIGASATGGGALGFVLVLGRGVLAVAAILLAGRLLLRPLFLQAARTRTPELFLAAALVVVIGSAGISTAAGLSPLIGALVAGIVLAETEYRRQIEATIAPFQGLLLGVFLIWTGMQLDLGAIAARPLELAAAVFAVVVVKTLVVTLLLRRFQRSPGTAVHTALLLAAPSETSLVILGAAVLAGLLAPATASFALLAAALGLALAPLLGMAGAIAEARLAHVAHPATPAPPPVEGRTIIIGFGRVGKMVATMLDVHGKPWLAVDGDPDRVATMRSRGKPVIYGDAKRPELLDALGLDTARAVVLTMDAAATIEVLVRRIRALHPALCVIARARDGDQAARLYQLGVTDAVPETVESSLQLAEAVLVDLGVPMGPVIASIHEKRAELRDAIQVPTQRPTLGRRRLRDAL
jgi:CPA2 family monovalent cation:H+ antiporter-2